MTTDVKALLAHIRVLERKIERLNQHHQCCSIVGPVSPPPDNETENINSSTGGSLQIILECPEEIEPPKLRNSIQPWQKVADQLLEDLQPSEQWPAQAKRFYLSKIDLNAWIIAHVCGGSAQVPAQMCEQNQIAQAGSVFASAKNYARGTKAARDNVTLFHQLQAFRELVFVSLCAVLEDLDYPLQEIDDTMREWLSDSADAYLKRLRSGAIWANNRIADLEIDDCTEWFFNHAISVSQYGQLSSSRSKSTPYITTGFLKQKISPPVVPSSRQGLSKSRRQFVVKANGDWTPLCIPAFIRIVSRNVLPLSQICSSLGYDCDLEIMTRLCNEYEIICRTASGSPHTEQQQTRKRKRTGGDGLGIEKRTCPISAVPHQQEGNLQLDIINQREETDPTGVPEGGSHQLTSITGVDSSLERGDAVSSRGESAEAEAPGSNNSIQTLLNAVQYMAESPDRALLDLGLTITPKEVDLLPGQPELYSDGWDLVDDLADMLGEPQLYGNGWDTFYTTHSES